MNDPMHGPEHWRKLAEKVRSVANSLADAEAKRGMLGVAKAYELIAELLEAREQDEQGPRK